MDLRWTNSLYCINMKLILNILWLDVINVNFINTLPNRKDRIMKTSMTIILWWDFDRKESEEEKNVFQNKCVSSQKIRMRKEEGATVAASHLPSLSWLSHVCHRPDRQRSPWKLYFTGKVHKIPQMSYLRRETPAISRINKCYKKCSWVWQKDQT